ncbi:DUF192 domain-containing protein [Microvirga subterranea]|uniref:DUF192 domain-containing protein n=1 Tax=Microvirga subterranea TaxID=186651 RepID=A0A370HNI4_9HYPH|nr:DUF192 domain-containing protein [Microvirga subterranea]RDI59785.1 hypothetical protein DES45_10339 [Microvirga subterranea]
MSLPVLRPLRALALAVGLCAAFIGAAYAQALESLAIVSPSGQRQSFQVEVARNEADRAQGLMFRRTMPADRGMLFDFGRVEPVAMWMQNTYLPLDMLFIRPDGTIARIAANTEPLSTRTIPSGEPVLAVLELNAGTAARLGIKAGDRIEHPLFKR